MDTLGSPIKRLRLSNQARQSKLQASLDLLRDASIWTCGRTYRKYQTRLRLLLDASTVSVGRVCCLCWTRVWTRLQLGIRKINQLTHPLWTASASRFLMDADAVQTGCDHQEQQTSSVISVDASRKKDWCVPGEEQGRLSLNASTST